MCSPPPKKNSHTWQLHHCSINANVPLLVTFEYLFKKACRIQILCLRWKEKSRNSSAHHLKTSEMQTLNSFVHAIWKSSVTWKDFQLWCVVFKFMYFLFLLIGSSLGYSFYQLPSSGFLMTLQIDFWHQLNTILLQSQNLIILKVIPDVTIQYYLGQPSS